MRRPVDRTETPGERFKRLAILRTNAVLDKIRILGNLSNKQLYKYSEEDIEKIFTAINSQVREAKGKFGSKKETGFRL